MTLINDTNAVLGSTVHTASTDINGASCKGKDYVWDTMKETVDQPISKQHVNFSLVFYPSQHNEYM